MRGPWKNQSRVNMHSSEAILLLNHGSRDPDAKVEFTRMARDLQARCDLPVQAAYLELAEPSVLDQLETLAQAGVRKVWALSAFLLAADHVKSDLPTALTKARREFGVEIEYSKPLGLHPQLLFAMRDRWHETLRGLPAIAKEETGVLVVGRGTSDPDANCEVAKLARLMYETGECGYAQSGYVSIARPTVEEGLTQCAAQGLKQVVVLPFFLCTGVLLKRIQQQTKVWAAARPDVRVVVAGHLGSHPGVIGALLDRLGQLRSGEDQSIWCDRCKFRLALPGHEHSAGAAITSDHDHGLRQGHSQSHSHSHAALPTSIPSRHLATPETITQRSFEIVDAELEARGLSIPIDQHEIVRRVVHTTADFDYAHLLEF